ncbi:hypothetical protein JTY60_00480 [symbiont of Argiope bruennichi]|uniref:hypothetical protein n=1 Tax=symbiont of Argiope bruennichi TaxID=2810479 RepID=UPI003DA5A073
MPYKKEIKKSIFLIVPLTFLVFLTFGYSLIDNKSNINQESRKLRYADNFPVNSKEHLTNNWISKIELEITNSQNINLTVSVVTGYHANSIFTICNVLVNNSFNTKKLHTMGTEDINEARRLRKTGKPIIGYLKYKFTYPVSIIQNNGILDIRIDVHGEEECLIANDTIDMYRYNHGKCNELPITIYDQISYQKSININDFIGPVSFQHIELKNNEQKTIKLLKSIYINPYFTVDVPNIEGEKTFKKNENAIWNPEYDYITIKKNKNHSFDNKFFFSDYEFTDYQDFYNKNGSIHFKSALIQEYNNNFYLPTKKIDCYLKKYNQKWFLFSNFDSTLETNNKKNFYFNVFPAYPETKNGILKNNIISNKTFLQINLFVKEKMNVSLLFPLHDEKPYFDLNNKGLIKIIDEKN